MSSSFKEIPVLDLSLAVSPLTRPALLAQLRHVLTSVGFLYVKNHGVPEPVIDSIIKLTPELFDLPKSTKEEIAIENSPHFLGYGGYDSETTGGRGDRREQFEFATELRNDHKEGDPAYRKLYGPNQVRFLFCDSID
jgi:isopenicillin N synthase-like dioxygenase